MYLTFYITFFTVSYLTEIISSCVLITGLEGTELTIKGRKSLISWLWKLGIRNFKCDVSDVQYKALDKNHRQAALLVGSGKGINTIFSGCAIIRT